jgi:hypothetical protein
MVPHSSVCLCFAGIPKEPIILGNVFTNTPSFWRGCFVVKIYSCMKSYTAVVEAKIILEFWLLLMFSPLLKGDLKGILKG